jgi:hypothetical protein
VHWSSLTEPTAAAIWGTVAVCAVLCVGLVLVILAMSVVQQRTSKRVASTAKEWAGYLDRLNFQDGIGHTLPEDPLCRAQIASLVLDAALRMDAGSRMPFARFIHLCKLESYILDVLARPRGQSPVVLETCATLAGLFGMQGALPHLPRLLEHRVAAVAFSASLAMLRLKPSAVPIVWARAPVQRFSKAALLTLLKAVPSCHVDQLVRRRLDKSDAKGAAQLLSAWGQLPGRAAVRYASDLLDQPECEGWLLCAALRMQDDVSQIGRIRPFLEHDRWAVRLQALHAVSRLGFAADIEQLKPLQDNANWWVSTRAREALAQFDPRSTL